MNYYVKVYDETNKELVTALVTRYSITNAVDYLDVGYLCGGGRMARPVVAERHLSIEGVITSKPDSNIQILPVEEETRVITL